MKVETSAKDAVKTGGMWSMGEAPSTCPTLRPFLSKAESALPRRVHVCVCACMWQQLSPPCLPLAIPLYPFLPSLALSLRLYRCSTSPAHSSLRWPGRHALSASPAWLLALLQHPTVPLSCALLPTSSLCLLLWVLPASLLPWLLLLELSHTTLLRRYLSALLLLAALRLTLSLAG
ncbi:hypothetical protein VZT92_020558 [Zoarces viviparus]|uniref:Uncharacterized protein n=1 Tax=Zoarces viviparus TaxID=48416 RepID=A0AAW1EFC1_ZOAVI